MQSFFQPGSFSYTIPSGCNDVIIRIWGAGGGSGGDGGGSPQDGSDGGDSNVDSIYIAGGGKGGLAASGGAGGAGGVATGGDTNISGSNGTSSTSSWGLGGSSPNGGSGTTTHRSDGQFPGGGASGSDTGGAGGSGGGGGGAFLEVSLSGVSGQTFSLTVGAGGPLGIGNLGGADGADGRVMFYVGVPTTVDPCDHNPSPGTLCLNGGQYVGVFDGNQYMTTNAGCTNSATPTCDGSEDSVYFTWSGSSGSQVDIAGVENITTATTPSSASARGDINTPIITADASTSSDSGADYCNNMVYGGYSDWYLPSKSELTFLYCRAQSTSHNTANPQEDPDCSANGGKVHALSGFNVSGGHYYMSSTEENSLNFWRADFITGALSTGSKTSTFVNYVRCIRRF